MRWCRRCVHEVCFYFLCLFCHILISATLHSSHLAVATECGFIHISKVPRYRVRLHRMPRTFYWKVEAGLVRWSRSQNDICYDEYMVSNCMQLFFVWQEQTSKSKCHISLLTPVKFISTKLLLQLFWKNNVVSKFCLTKSQKEVTSKTFCTHFLSQYWPKSPYTALTFIYHFSIFFPLPSAPECCKKKSSGFMPYSSTFPAGFSFTVVYFLRAGTEV